jgi:hypothetical protein
LRRILDRLPVNGRIDSLGFLSRGRYAIETKAKLLQKKTTQKNERPAAEGSAIPKANLGLLLSESAWADTFRVHYSVRGNGRDITVQAESSAEARRTVMNTFPDANRNRC